MTAINAEERTREALEWALEHTCLAIPPGYRTAAFWQWNGDDVQLQATTADGDFRFHVAAERRRGVKTRIAILSWEDDQGTATWEAEMPNEGRRAVLAALEAVMPEGESGELEQLREALASAGRSLEWAARRMKDNCCRDSDVAAVRLAAGKTTEARAALAEGGRDE